MHLGAALQRRQCLRRPVRHLDRHKGLGFWHCPLFLLEPWRGIVFLEPWRQHSRRVCKSQRACVQGPPMATLQLEVAAAKAGEAGRAAHHVAAQTVDVQLGADLADLDAVVVVQLHLQEGKHENSGFRTNVSSARKVYIIQEETKGLQFDLEGPEGQEGRCP